MLDFDLAALYGVETKRLKERVRRNINRFPDDFMFELSEEEFKSLRTQIATSNRGGRRYSPMAFTEQVVAMLSSVLNSEKAIQVNIERIALPSPSPVFRRMNITEKVTVYKQLLPKL